MTFDENAELRLLLAAADPGQARTIEHELRASLDWDRLLDMAQWHGLAQRLYAWLDRTPNCAPDYVLESLYRTTSSALALNMHLATQLLTLSGQLCAACIPHIVYKGPLLASMLYGNLGLRTSTDLDIVIPEARLAQTRDLLLGLGFADRYSLTEAQQGAAFRFGYEHGFVSAQANVTVDLHWRVVPRYVSPYLDMEAMFSRAVHVKLFGRELPTFCPEDLLLVLCLHASQHDWAHISLFSDIAQVIRGHRNFNWDIFDRQIKDWNTRRVVNVSLLLAQNLDLELPATVAASISTDRAAAQIAASVAKRIWSSRTNPQPQDANVSWLLERSKGEPVLNRIRWIAGVAFSPTLADFQAFRAPGSQSSYPVLRLLRLLAKRTGLNRFRHG